MAESLALSHMGPASSMITSAPARVSTWAAIPPPAPTAPAGEIRRGAPAVETQQSFRHRRRLQQPLGVVNGKDLVLGAVHDQQRLGGATPPLNLVLTVGDE